MKPAKALSISEDIGADIGAAGDALVRALPVSTAELRPDTAKDAGRAAISEWVSGLLQSPAGAAMAGPLSRGCGAMLPGGERDLGVALQAHAAHRAASLCLGLCSGSRLRLPELSHDAARGAATTV